jgi:PAS domain S-box-containing protein
MNAMHCEGIRNTDLCFETVFDCMPVPCIITDGKMIERINRNLLDFLDFDSTETFFEHHRCISELFQTRRGYLSPSSDKRSWVEQLIINPEREYKILLSNGNESHTFLLRTQPLTLETATYHIVTFHDVTVTDNLQNKLLMEYKETVDRSAIVSKTDPQGIITFVNQKFCDISGYSEEELIGMPHNISRHPDMPASLFNEMWQTISSKKPWYGTIKNLTRDGRTYYVDTVINPIIDCNGEIVEYIAVRYDITKIETIKENLFHELEETEKEVIFRMGEIGEVRSLETANHVKRVAEYSRLLAFKKGLDENEASLLHLASPMHDIGKVAVPDHILNKKGELTSEEWTVMKSHCERGYNILKSSERPILKTAAIIAYQHHEKYDGTGYPQGLKGEEIHIFSRITAIADVFDALSMDRPYKDSWPLEKIFAFLRANRGTHFDPGLIDIFFEHVDEFLAIRERYRDNVKQSEAIAARQ